MSAPRGVGGGGHRGHVLARARPVVHFRQQHHGRVVEAPLGEVAHLVAAEQPGQPLHHVVVGGEVRGVGDDHPALGTQPQRGRHRLEDRDRGGVAHHDLAGARADERGQAVADGERLLVPAGVVPAADELLTPLLLDRAPHPLRRTARQRAQRVADEVDHAFRQDELVLEGPQRVLRVEGEALVAIQRSLLIHGGMVAMTLFTPF
ncbi:hypothetical protein GCM10020001_042020 [Nonomuraea salmonea]